MNLKVKSLEGLCRINPKNIDDLWGLQMKILKGTHNSNELYRIDAEKDEMQYINVLINIFKFP